MHKVIETGTKEAAQFMHDAAKPFAVVLFTDGAWRRVVGRYATERYAKWKARILNSEVRAHG